MANKYRSSALALAVLLLGGAAAEAAEGIRADLVNRKTLRVCADPANVPFSSDDPDKPGFENKIADIVADELGGIPVEYTWFPQATGFIRRTLSSKACDLVVGFAQGDELVLNTNHYYRSTYALVFRKEASDLNGVTELSDPKLKGKRIGVVAGTPPATILTRVGLIASAKPYHLFVDRRYDSPAEKMIKDIRSGEVDAGIMWGPNAGYFANQDGKDDLSIVPLVKEGRTPPMAFRITMGVRQADVQWKRELNDIIKKRQGDIDQVLLDFKVPIIDEKDRQITSARTAR